jgi:hypothetical protein
MSVPLVDRATLWRTPCREYFAGGDPTGLIAFTIYLTLIANAIKVVWRDFSGG